MKKELYNLILENRKIAGDNYWKVYEHLKIIGINNYKLPYGPINKGGNYSGHRIEKIDKGRGSRIDGIEEIIKSDKYAKDCLGVKDEGSGELKE